MNDPVSNNNLPPTSHGHGNAYGRADGPVLETITDFMLPGVSFEQAVQDALDAGAISPSDLKHAGLAEQVEKMPPGHQRQLADNAQSLPPELREALERLGLTRPESRESDRVPDGAGQRTETTGVPQGGAALRGEAANAAQGLSRGEANAAAQTAQASGTIPAQSAAPVAPGVVERAQFDGLVSQARVGDASTAMRAEVVIPAFNPERVQPSPLQALPQQAVLAPQGRTDAVPAQLLPQAAGATVLASPQGAVLAPNATAPVPRGAESAQARDGQLAPAGHTLAAGQRRDGRRGDSRPQQRHHPAESLLALLPGRRRRRAEGEEEATSFQWLFWLLTIVAYGALAVAIIAMIPSGGGLTDNFGRPGYGAYALVVGAIAAAASWFVGRRLSKR